MLRSWLVCLALALCAGCAAAKGAWDDVHGTWNGAVDLFEKASVKTLHGSLAVTHIDQAPGFTGLEVVFGNAETGLFNSARLSGLALVNNPAGQPFDLDFVWDSEQRYIFIVTYEDTTGTHSLSQVAGPFEKGDLAFSPDLLTIDAANPQLDSLKIRETDERTLRGWLKVTNGAATLDGFSGVTVTFGHAAADGAVGTDKLDGASLTDTTGTGQGFTLDYLWSETEKYDLTLTCVDPAGKARVRHGQYGPFERANLRFTDQPFLWDLSQPDTDLPAGLLMKDGK